MGTLIRSAYNLGWDSVCIVGEAVDPFNDKSLRGAKGTTFFSHITTLKDWTELNVCIYSTASI